jgi:thiamine-phosphate pyrophosphorylase
VSRQNNSPLASQHLVDRKPILCYVTDRRSLEAATQTASLDLLLEKIEQIAAAGIDWIQLREKDLSARSCASLAREALRRASKRTAQAGSPVRPLTGLPLRIPPRILVNDRLDVAIAEQADGVHLGENSLPPRDAQRLIAASQSAQTLPQDFILGVSCHSLEAAQSAAAAGANYIFFGPIFPTPSKATYGAPQGLDRLSEACASVKIPVLAIGGITLENAAACLAAGASGIAAIRLFQDSSDPSATVNAIRRR